VKAPKSLVDASLHRRRCLRIPVSSGTLENCVSHLKLQHQRDIANQRTPMKVGDIVYLKSGSDRLTVEKIAKDGRVVCIAFDVRRNLRRYWFPRDALRVPPPQSDY
jgi:uncharacterized protein YodC (DUF2158 family)